MFVAEDKIFLISNPFFCQIAMNVMPLFEHELITPCLYFSMQVRLKWVGTDKLLEYVLRFMGIRVTANVYYYL